MAALAVWPSLAPAASLSEPSAGPSLRVVAAGAAAPWLVPDRPEALAATARVLERVDLDHSRLALAAEEAAAGNEEAKNVFKYDLRWELNTYAHDLRLRAAAAKEPGAQDAVRAELRDLALLHDLITPSVQIGLAEAHESLEAGAASARALWDDPRRRFTSDTTAFSRPDSALPRPARLAPRLVRRARRTLSRLLDSEEERARLTNALKQGLRPGGPGFVELDASSWLPPELYASLRPAFRDAAMFYFGLGSGWKMKEYGDGSGKARGTPYELFDLLARFGAQLARSLNAALGPKEEVLFDSLQLRSTSRHTQTDAWHADGGYFTVTLALEGSGTHSTTERRPEEADKTWRPRRSAATPAGRLLAVTAADRERTVAGAEATTHVTPPPDGLPRMLALWRFSPITPARASRPRTRLSRPAGPRPKDRG